MKLLKKAGFDHFAVGIESGSERILKDVLDKGITLDQIYDTNKKIIEHGFAVTYNFMSGIPGETFEDYGKTLKLMYYLLRTNEHLIAPVGLPKFFYPQPNTILGNKCSEEGFETMGSFRDWGNYEYINRNCSWRSEEFDNVAIKAIQITGVLREKFSGENANITENDYKPLLELIDSVDERVKKYGPEIANSYSSV